MSQRQFLTDPSTLLVITDPNDPKFDLEAYLTTKQADAAS